MTGLARKWKERVNFIFPVLFVIGFASVLVYFSLLSTIQVHAVVFQASEGQSAPWWQGILNALIFIIPAVGFAFVIAFLVKKRRMNVIRQRVLWTRKRKKCWSPLSKIFRRRTGW